MFSSKLLKLMKESGISQSELASELQTHRQNVYQWVSGKTVPRNDMLIKLADFFKVSIDHLLDKGNKTSTLKIKAESTNSFHKQLVKRKLNQKFSTNQNLKEIFSDNLKYYRKQAGLTQDDFAKAVNTDPVYISYIENGKRFPSIEYIERMAEILKVESYKLFLPANIDINEISKEVLCNKLKEKITVAINEVLEQ